MTTVKKYDSLKQGLFACMGEHMELLRRTRFLLQSNPPPSLGTILEELGKLTHWGQNETHKKTVRSLITRSDKKGYEHSGGAADDCWRFLLNEKILTDTGNGNCTFDPLAGAAVLARSKKEDPNEAVKNMRFRLDKDQRPKIETTQTAKKVVPGKGDTNQTIGMRILETITDRSGPGVTNTNTDTEDTDVKKENEPDTTPDIIAIGHRVDHLSTNIEETCRRLKAATACLASQRKMP